MFAQIDTVMASAASAHRDRANGQASMFDDLRRPPAAKSSEARTNTRTGWTPWTNAEKLAHEKELLGFYVTGHPLNPYRSVLRTPNTFPVTQLCTEERPNFHAAGSLTEVIKKFSKKDGKPFAIIKLEDFSGSMEAMIWNAEYTKYLEILGAGSGGGDQRPGERRAIDELSAVVSEVAPRCGCPKRQGRSRCGCILRWRSCARMNSAKLRDLLAASPGECPVELEFRRAGRATFANPGRDRRTG